MNNMNTQHINNKLEGFNLLNNIKPKNEISNYPYEVLNNAKVIKTFNQIDITVKVKGDKSFKGGVETDIIIYG